MILEFGQNFQTLLVV